MLKRMNKRAQEGMSITTIIGLIIAIVVLVVVVLGFTMGWDYIFSFFKKSNVDVAFITQKCEVLASSGIGGYCNDRIELSKNNYVNCPYAVTTFNISLESNIPNCDSDAGAKAICNKLRLEQGDKYNPDKTKVNGKRCTELGV